MIKSAPHDLTLKLHVDRRRPGMQEAEDNLFSGFEEREAQRSDAVLYLYQEPRVCTLTPISQHPNGVRWVTSVRFR